MHLMRNSTLAATAAASVLVLTSCGAGEGDGIGDAEALSGVELHLPDEGDPEVILHSAIETEEPGSRILSAGDGDQVDEEAILEFRMAAVDPSDGTMLEQNFSEPSPNIFWLPTINETGMAVDEFFYEALTEDGVTIGTELAVYHPGDPEAGYGEQLMVLQLEDQYPPYADGDVQDQSGDLPEIENEIGERPELVDHDTDSEAPSELSTEVLIEGDGAEIAEDDHLVVHYRGWRWEDGEEFDGSWSDDGELSVPASFSLQAVIPGWTEGIAGHHVGDRLLLVIPPDLAYGETEDEDEGVTADGGPGGALIFVVDLVQAVSAEDIPEPEGQPEQMPEDMDLDEEELEELLEQMEQEQAEGEEQPENEEDE